MVSQPKVTFTIATFNCKSLRVGTYQLVFKRIIFLHCLYKSISAGLEGNYLSYISTKSSSQRECNKSLLAVLNCALNFHSDLSSPKLSLTLPIAPAAPKFCPAYEFLQVFPYFFEKIDEIQDLVEHRPDRDGRQLYHYYHLLVLLVLPT